MSERSSSTFMQSVDTILALALQTRSWPIAEFLVELDQVINEGIEAGHITTVRMQQLAHVREMGRLLRRFQLEADALGERIDDENADKVRDKTDALHVERSEATGAAEPSTAE